MNKLVQLPRLLVASLEHEALKLQKRSGHTYLIDMERLARG